MLGNNREDLGVLEERQGGVEDQQGTPDPSGGPNNNKFESISESRSSTH
jgi:hypothetical protein